MRFIKRESEHRSFIRAYLFDYIFKTFIQLLDECISQRERLVSENKEEWEYYSIKKQDRLEGEVKALQKQISKM